MLCLIDEFTREALVIRVKRKLNSTDVLETLADVMIVRGTPTYIRSDNGPEFIALTLRKWIADVGTQTAYIEPGSPWENGFCERLVRQPSAQQQASRRAVEPGGLLQPTRSRGADRELATALQHRAPA